MTTRIEMRLEDFTPILERGGSPLRERQGVHLFRWGEQATLLGDDGPGFRSSFQRGDAGS